MKLLNPLCSITKIYFILMCLFLLLSIFLLLMDRYYYAYACGAPAYILLGAWGGRYINKGWK